MLRDTAGSRQKVMAAFLRLWRPLRSKFSPGRARVRLHGPAAHYSAADAELEAFARPMWGVVPLIAGGSRFPDWDLYLDGLAAGTDPEHPEHWHVGADFQHALVEMAPFGLMLALIPEQSWGRLDPRARGRLTHWMRQINRLAVYDNNWLFVRVIVNLGLRLVGAGYDADATARALARLDSFYRDGGWYVDGCNRHYDYYNAFAMHFYGLLYAQLAHDDPSRGDCFRDRAAAFAPRFLAWFSSEGQAVPFGRSLTYRFAQGAFWGAMAFAGVQTLSFPVLKGLYMRHLQWWLRRPILHPDRTLSVGYGYPSLTMSEAYNSAGSPYWAFTFFLPLALPETHPFWTAEAAALPDSDAVTSDPDAGAVTFGTEGRRQVIMLNGGQDGHRMRSRAAKYGKFAYSTHFAFNVPGESIDDAGVAFDSSLAVSIGDGRFYARDHCTGSQVSRQWVFSRWQAMADVCVESLVLAVPPWHVRIHRVVARQDVICVEGGFPMSTETGYALRGETDSGVLCLIGMQGGSGLRDESGGRTARVVHCHPYTNLEHPYTDVPVLTGRYAAGVVWLFTAVLGTIDAKVFAQEWADPPSVAATADALTIRDVRVERDDIPFSTWSTEAGDSWFS